MFKLKFETFSILNQWLTPSLNHQMTRPSAAIPVRPTSIHDPFTPENTFNSEENVGTIDRPRTPGKYESTTCAETIAEIRAEKMVNSRPLIKMKFIRPRKFFG